MRVSVTYTCYQFIIDLITWTLLRQNKIYTRQVDLIGGKTIKSKRIFNKHYHFIRLRTCGVALHTRVFRFAVISNSINGLYSGQTRNFHQKSDVKTWNIQVIRIPALTTSVRYTTRFFRIIGRKIFHVVKTTRPDYRIIVIRVEAVTSLCIGPRRIFQNKNNHNLR